MENTFLTKIPVAHRGLHTKEFPENSLPAFGNAVCRGYAVETDVRLSKDGIPVVFHDATLARMTGLEKRVNELTAKELRQLRLKDSSERIPLFSEFLEYLGGRAPLLLEIKNMPKTDTDEFLGKVSAALNGYRGEYAVQSFQPIYVKKYKRMHPEILCGVLGTHDAEKADFDGSPFWRILAHVMKNMSMNRSVKPDFISYNFAGFPQKATEKFQGIKLAWTVRSPEDEKRARKYADNIIFENYLPVKHYACR